MNKTDRFSPTNYAVSLERTQESNESNPLYMQSIQGEEQFQQLAEEVRTFLSAPRGLSEEERRNYGEVLNKAVLGYPQQRKQIMSIIEERLIRLRLFTMSNMELPYHSLAEALFAEVVGLNVLELILAQKNQLEEIQVVGTKIYEVRNGETSLSAYSFASIADVERIQQNLVLYNNDRINPRKRWAEVMLQDGSRVTMTGFGFTSQPTLTIRFYTITTFTLDELATTMYSTMNKRMIDMLRMVLQARFNLVIIGATNSGKTHLMKSLIAEIPSEERIVTIEGRYEMMISRDFPDKNIVEYEATEDDEMHQAEQAFKLALRQSPKRIIHAEIRDSDANIYVRACTRGHAGSMTTVHANRLEDVPEAIADMCMLDGRAMNPGRLVKRITQYVTQIGIEMRYWQGRRIIARIGEFVWRDGETSIRDWVQFDYTQHRWKFPYSPSIQAQVIIAEQLGHEVAKQYASSREVGE
ncbi:ATPase, T2SS/T4P/T4SS family [Paenibacillus yanchengensis]|uniref:ATPase, T2SS/T4P/T4SS family n=1 Tax=Paenibacillus yanchengensis TaxID=2035833 RepID=A0ABW4YJ06_9BACL